MKIAGRMFLLCLVFIVALPEWSEANFDYNKEYSFHIPRINEATKNYESVNVTYKVTIEKLGKDSFILKPVLDRMWLKSLKEYRSKGWYGRFTKDGLVTISGIWGQGEAYFLLELKGKELQKGTFKGRSALRVGVSQGLTPLTYETDWVLEPSDVKKKTPLSNIVTYSGPLGKKIVAIPSTTQEEWAKRPITSDRQIKNLAKSKKRERFYKRKKKGSRNKAYYDGLLSELTWDEMKHTPGILILIDHLATLAPDDQQRIAKSYVKDGTYDIYGNIPYGMIKATPPLFLILKVVDNLKAEDLKGLKKESPRFLTMLEAYEETPPSKLAGLSIKDFIIKISENLSSGFREEYYKSSLKLRNYVAMDESGELKVLYPFEE